LLALVLLGRGQRYQSPAGETEQNGGNHGRGCSIEELLVSSFAQTDALAKLLNREGHHHAAGISREDFRRASDISGDVKADAILMQMNLAAAVELWRPSVQS
jgi:hypothetical protein